jgi:hypothetical protein
MSNRHETLVPTTGAALLAMLSVALTRLPASKLILLLLAVAITSCATRQHIEPRSCCTTLPLKQIAHDLGFKLVDYGMHDYGFESDWAEFHLLASSSAISLIDDSSRYGRKFKPIWTLNGKPTEEEVKRHIRAYLYGG